MDERALTALHDICASAADILRFVGNTDKSMFDANDMLRAAVERKYLIIGEALNRLKKCDLVAFMYIREADKIIGFRNVLAHGYDVVDDDVSWSIISDKLPLLVADVEQLLGQ